MHIKHWGASGEGENGAVLPDTLGVGKKQSWALGKMEELEAQQVDSTATTNHASKCEIYIC